MFEAYARSLDLLKRRAPMMRRLEYGHDVEVVMTRMCLNDLMRFVNPPVTITLQLPSFFDANFVEHVVIDICIA